MKSGRPDETSTNSTQLNKTNTTDNRFLQALIQETKRENISLEITVDSIESYEKTKTRHKEGFTYQPSTLWIVFDNEFAFPLLQTPHTDRGFTHDPTEPPTDAHPVSNDFWYHFHEQKNQMVEQQSTPPNITDQSAPIHERHHLHELLLRIYSPHYKTPNYSELIERQAEKEIRNTFTTTEQTNQHQHQAEVN